MCGITGYFSLENKIETKKYYQSHLLIKHRGPDDEGFLIENNSNITICRGDDTIDYFNNQQHITEIKSSKLILGHRRLSIIDLSQGGHQPYMFDGLCIVFNGEIFNYIEIKKELIEKGYSFNSESDTEVILKAYHCWGLKAFNKFNGMWAIAIYDEKKEELLLIRDRFGIKPLYYAIIDNAIYFASEVKFILPFLSEIKVNESMLYDYVIHCHIWHTEATMFSGISQIEPGYYATFKNTLKKKKYYYFEDYKNSDKIDLQKLIKKSVNNRLLSDVEVGGMLSGGIDSTAIVCAVKDYIQTNNFKTFSITFKEKELDFEKEYIKDTLEKTNFTGHNINISHNTFHVDDLLETIEFPFRSFTIPSQQLIFSFVKNNTNVKVLLSGEGADEVFSGYNGHRYYYLGSLLQDFNLKLFIEELKHVKELMKESTLKVLKKSVSCIIQNSMFYKTFKGHNLELRVFENYKNFVKKNNKYSKDIFSNNLLKGIKFSALREYLMYSDLNSMKYSIEVRVPFLDYRLVEYGLSINKHNKVVNGITKHVLREAVKDFIPDSVYKRKDKKGFFTPFEEWCNTKLIPEFDEVFNNLDNNCFEFLDKKQMLEIYDEFKKGKFQDYAFIWRLFLALKWKRKWNVNG